MCAQLFEGARSGRPLPCSHVLWAPRQPSMGTRHGGQQPRWKPVRSTAARSFCGREHPAMKADLGLASSVPFPPTQHTALPCPAGVGAQERGGLSLQSGGRAGGCGSLRPHTSCKQEQRAAPHPPPSSSSEGLANEGHIEDPSAAPGCHHLSSHAGKRRPEGTACPPTPLDTQFMNSGGGPGVHQ